MQLNADFFTALDRFRIALWGESLNLSIGEDHKFYMWLLSD